MKKILASLVMVFGFVFTSVGSAQSDGFGVYSGWPELLGVQFQTNNLRLGAGFAFAGLGASADYILGESAIQTGPGMDLSWYYGAGVSAGFWSLGGFSGIYVFPHGLVGLEWQVPQTSFSVYGEGQIGVGLYLGNLSGYRGTGLDFATRVGVIFR